MPSEPPPPDLNDPTAATHYSENRGRPWWFTALCYTRNSDAFVFYYFRFYLDFTAYYITLFAAAFNTVIILVLAKHLYRALYLNEERVPDRKHNVVQVNPIVATGKQKRLLQQQEAAQAQAQQKQQQQVTNNNTKGSVAINMGHCGPELEGCIDDNFCIEVILATFDFFRVSETKQD